ncbi:MAG: HEAT repeat domain-containing protein, partial [Candidatus Heimdallarchaeota archaeon]
MDKYSREVMTALSSVDYDKAVLKYLLSYDIENWKIFTDNYYKLTPFEAERIFNVISKKMDFHMIIDILSLAHIIGSSISLSLSLIKIFCKLDVSNFEEHISENILRLLQSPIAEERRIGLFMAGYFDRDDFFDEIEKMSNYDILFEDAYFSLGLMSDSKIVNLLSTKFVFLSKNHIQRQAIAKILVQKGNPLAALWLFKNKEFDFNTSFSKSIYIARELAWLGIKPALFLDSNDDFLQPITYKFLNAISAILSYDIELVEEIDLLNTIRKLLQLLEVEPTIDLIKTTYTIKNAVKDLYFDIDPYSVNKETRNQIINSWKILNKFPNEKIFEFLGTFVSSRLSPDNEEFILALRIIGNFHLKEFETRLIGIGSERKISPEQDYELINCLGKIGNDSSVDHIILEINRKVNTGKRNNSSQESNLMHSDVDYIDDFDNELLRTINQSFTLDVLSWFNYDFTELYYWNALFALGNLRNEKALATLQDALDDYDPKIRYQAINSIKSINVLNDLIEEKLVNLSLHESFMSVQREAISALGTLNSQTVIPIFVKSIYQAIEAGILELAEEIDVVYENRWDEDEYDESTTKTQKRDAEEIGATHKVSEKIAAADKKLAESDIYRWIDRLNSKSSKPLELREDFITFDHDDPEQIDFFERTTGT